MEALLVTAAWIDVLLPRPSGIAPRERVRSGVAVGAMRFVKERLQSRDNPMSNAEIREGSDYNPRIISACLGKYADRGMVARLGGEPMLYRWVK
jgi:hypothetical protein